jgi:prepilin-type N-terminal cleavage/methylation domain-containing protein
MRRSRGFTLIEIAVVVALIGIMLTAGLKIAGALLENAAYTATLKKEQAIKESLIGFLGKYKRLPCPDTAVGTGNTIGFSGGAPDGLENVNGVAGTGDCASNYGVLPYATLGLPRDAALDGWQNYFTYQVTTSASPTFAWNKTASGYPEGNPATGINIENDPLTGGPLTTFPTPAIVVVVSYGANGYGAFTVNGSQNSASPNSDEQKNYIVAASTTPAWSQTAGPTFYVSGQLTDNPTAPNGPFDDLVMSLAVSDLMNPLYQNNILPPATGAANQDLLNMRNAMLAYVAGQMTGSRCPVPVALPGMVTAAGGGTTDPWGQNWQYTVGTPGNKFDSGNTPGTTFLKIFSPGPPGGSQMQTLIYDSDFEAYVGGWGYYSGHCG